MSGRRNSCSAICYLTYFFTSKIVISCHAAWKLNHLSIKKINTWDQCFHVWKLLMKHHYFKYQYTSRLICPSLLPDCPSLARFTLSAHTVLWWTSHHHRCDTSTSSHPLVFKSSWSSVLHFPLSSAHTGPGFRVGWGAWYMHKDTVIETLAVHPATSRLRQRLPFISCPVLSISRKTFIWQLLY